MIRTFGGRWGFTSPSQVIRQYVRVVSLVLGLSITALWPAGAVDSGQTAVVMVENLNLRAEPGLKGMPLTQLPRATRLPVIQRSGGWIKVQYETKSGYIIDDPRYVQVVTEAADQSVTGLEQTSRQLEKKLADHQARLKDYQIEATEVINSLDAIDRSLNQVRRQVTATKKELAALKKKIAKTRAESDQVHDRIEKSRGYAARRLVALYKLYRLGKVQMLASADSFHDLLYRKAALEHILDYDRQILDDLAANQNRLKQLGAAQEKNRIQQQQLKGRLQNKIDRMQKDKASRALLLATIREQETLELAAIENLKQSAQALDRQIKALVNTPVPPPPPNPIPVPSTPKPARIADAKGMLQMPVNGAIVAGYGHYQDRRTKTKNFRSGIEIKAELGEPVRSIGNGRVMHAAWFRSYGNVMIVSHGNHYYSVYGRLEEFFKKRGDVVEAGEVIATVGDSGSLSGARLYFEIRHHGKPLDPAQWLKKG